MTFTEDQYKDKIKKLLAKIEDMDSTIDHGHRVHSSMSGTQNKMVLFMKEKGILNEYYQLNN